MNAETSQVGLIIGGIVTLWGVVWGAVKIVSGDKDQIAKSYRQLAAELRNELHAMKLENDKFRTELDALKQARIDDERDLNTLRDQLRRAEARNADLQDALNDALSRISELEQLQTPSKE